MANQRQTELGRAVVPIVIGVLGAVVLLVAALFVAIALSPDREEPTPPPGAILPIAAWGAVRRA